MSNLPAIIVALVLFYGPSVAALAADTGKKAQTTRMSQCSTEAKEKGLKGDARKDHMSQCLRNPATQAAARECNVSAEEKGLKGNRRKEFVSECVKTKANIAPVG